MKKFCECLREPIKNIVDFKKTNVTVIKRRIKITPKCKSMIHLQKKKSYERLLKTKIIKTPKIIAITQVNIEAQHSIFVI